MLARTNRLHIIQTLAPFDMAQVFIENTGLLQKPTGLSKIDSKQCCGQLQGWLARLFLVPCLLSRAKLCLKCWIVVCKRKRQTESIKFDSRVRRETMASIKDCNLSKGQIAQKTI